MSIEDMIQIINYKELNPKCNHFIFYGLTKSELKTIVTNINPKSVIENYEQIDFDFYFDNDIKTMNNVIVDTKDLNIQSLFNIVLEQLRIAERISFEDRKSLRQFIGILRRYEQSIQLIFQQDKCLDIETQKRLNELFAFNSYFMSVTYLLQDNDFSTYQTLHGEMLDDRENYQKIHVWRLP